VVDDVPKLKVVKSGGRCLTCNVANKVMPKSRVIFEKVTVAGLISNCLVI
jgi:hypothetical protein